MKTVFIIYTFHFDELLWENCKLGAMEAKPHCGCSGSYQYTEDECLALKKNLHMPLNALRFPGCC